MSYYWQLKYGSDWTPSGNSQIAGEVRFDTPLEAVKAFRAGASDFMVYRLVMQYANQRIPLVSVILRGGGTYFITELDHTPF